ncbi:MAG TPA: DUF5004 domain-containing protein [Bacteroidetes bacterium]|nr:DUF5004 domain-containing protein [Bacteroidota bacterium]
MADYLNVVAMKTLAINKMTVFCCIFSLFLASCGSKSEETHHHALIFSSESNLIGEWEQVKLQVELDHAAKEDQGRILQVDRENWEEKMQARPARLIFKDDHTYVIEIKNLNDSVVKTRKGHWELTGDSLFMDQTHPDWASFSYRIELKPGEARLDGKLDWDGDGKANEKYICVQRRIH